MVLSAVALIFASATAQAAPQCPNLSTQSVSELPVAERLTITACAQRLAADAINAQQATRHDPRMTLKADVEGSTLRYNYRLALDARQVPEPRRAEMERMIRADQCADAGARVVLANGGSYRFIWKDRSGAVIRDVLIDRC